VDCIKSEKGNLILSKVCLFYLKVFGSDQALGVIMR